MKYWLITYQQDGNFTCKTAVDYSSSPFHFILIEWELGRRVHLVNALELTEEQYKLFVKTSA